MCQRENSSPADNNVVVITPQLMSMAHDLRRTVSAHLVPGFIRSSDWDDDMLLDTANMQTTIRINVFHLHNKVRNVGVINVGKKIKKRQKRVLSPKLKKRL